MSKGARLRMEKKLKEEEEHKKRMANMAAAKGTTKKVVRPKFDRSKLSSGFMANAKTSKDEVNGWALDFDNETQNVIKEDKDLLTAFSNSLTDSTKAGSETVKSESVSAVSEPTSAIKKDETP